MNTHGDDDDGIPSPPLVPARSAYMPQIHPNDVLESLQKNYMKAAAGSTLARSDVSVDSVKPVIEDVDVESGVPDFFSSSVAATLESLQQKNAQVDHHGDHDDEEEWSAREDADIEELPAAPAANFPTLSRERHYADGPFNHSLKPPETPPLSPRVFSQDELDDPLMADEIYQAKKAEAEKKKASYQTQLRDHERRQLNQLNKDLAKQQLNLAGVVRNLREQADVRYGVVEFCMFALYMVLFFACLLLQGSVYHQFQLDHVFRRSLIENEWDVSPFYGSFGNKDLFDVVEIPHIYRWLRNIYANNLFPSADSLGVNDTLDDMFLWTTNNIVKEPELKQQRCRLPFCLQPLGNAVNLTCRNDKMAPGGSFGPVEDEGKYSLQADGYYHTPLKDLWRDRKAAKKPISKEEVIEIINNLERDDWVSWQTCLLVVSVWIFNPHFGAFSTLRVEFTVSGSGIVKAFVLFEDTGSLFGSYIQSQRYHLYETDTDSTRGLLEVFFVLCTLYRIYSGVKEWWSRRQLGNFGAFMTGENAVWDYINTIFNACIVICIFSRVAQILLMNSGLDSNGVFDVQTLSTSITAAVGLHYAIACIVGVLCAFKMFRYFRLFPKMSLFTATLWGNIGELVYFGVVIITNLLLFSFVGQRFFGHGSELFVTFRKSFYSCLTIAMGSFDYDSFEVADNSFGLVPPIFFWGCTITVAFMLLNMFVSLVVGTYNTTEELDKYLKAHYSEPGTRTFMEWLEPLTCFRWVPSESKMLYLFEYMGWIERVVTSSQTCNVFTTADRSIEINFTYYPQWELEPEALIILKVDKPDIDLNVGERHLDATLNGTWLSASKARVRVSNHTISLPAAVCIEDFTNVVHCHVVVHNVVKSRTKACMLGRNILWKTVPPYIADAKADEQRHSNILIQEYSQQLIDFRNLSHQYWIKRVTVSGLDIKQCFLMQFEEARMHYDGNVFLRTMSRVDSDIMQPRFTELNAAVAAMQMTNRHVVNTTAEMSVDNSKLLMVAQVEGLVERVAFLKQQFVKLCQHHELLHSREKARLKEGVDALQALIKEGIETMGVQK